jgi:two-component system, OmpR family, response regulator MprA
MTTSSAEKKQILFVDDDEVTQELVTLTLSNHEIITAHNFTEGLRLALDRHFDLYLLDNWLPDGSGVELCRSIRKFDIRTPVLFYSAAALARDTQEALGAGAQEYLVKPVAPEELRRAVARWVVIPTLNQYEPDTT